MFDAWFLAPIPEGGDPRLAWKQDPNVPATAADLAKCGVLHFKITSDEQLDKICAERGYTERDEVECGAACGQPFDDKLKMFFTEHIHEDEEIRLCLEGGGYFDFRSPCDKWIRAHVLPGDLLILPAGIYHRFTTDEGGHIKARRIFTSAPKWVPINRPCDDNDVRKQWAATYATAKKISTEVPLLDGKTYHLPAAGPVGEGLNREDIARRVILVGDPERVELFEQWFEDITYRASNRELRVLTGFSNGVYVSVVSTGMGPDNTEIVLNELHVLNEFNVETGEWLPKDQVKPMALLRIGTCGSPNEDIRAGNIAVSSFAIGGDNVGRWYVRDDISADEKAVAAAAAAAVPEMSQWTYAAGADSRIVDAVVATTPTIADGAYKAVVGITYTAPGFYAPQGRAVGRLASSLLVPGLTDRLAGLSVEAGGKTEHVVNIEMETAALLHLSRMLGYHAGAACLVIAARAKGQGVFLSGDDKKNGILNGPTQRPTWCRFVCGRSQPPLL